jgi:DNA excision repair protein ERCC-4
MKILIDTREQAPFIFMDYEVEPVLATLPVGDYSLPGFEDRVSIERKSLNDLIGCLMNSILERFDRELARRRHQELFAVVGEPPIGNN